MQYIQDPQLQPLLSPVLSTLFRRPQRLGKPSGWWGHVPFAGWLVEALRPRVLVELGTHHGVSYAAFCEAVRSGQLPTRCYAVDSWAGDAHAGFFDPAVYQDVKAFNDAHYAAFSELIRTDFDAAVGHFADGSIDLLHIDGFHTYEAVRHDYETWRSRLSARSVVVFHDTNVRRDDFGVHRFFAELAAEFPHFEFLHGNGLGLLAHGKDMAEPIASLCALNGTEQGGLLCDRFAALGARWQGLANEQEMERSFAEQVRNLQAHHARELGASQGASALVRTQLAEAQAGLENAQRSERRLRDEREEVLRETVHLRNEVGRMHQAYAELERGLHELQQVVAQLSDRNTDLTVALQGAERTARGLLPSLLERSATAEPPAPLGLLQRMQERVGGRAERPAPPTDLELVRRSPFFDAEWYLQTYPDVAAAGTDAAEHYALHGGTTENRDPGPWFSTSAYLLDNPDVAAQGLNALAHFEAHGQHEDRAFPMRSLVPLPRAVTPLPVATAVDVKQAFRQQSRQELADFLSSDRQLVLPTVEQPRVSVIVVLYNQAELTFKCIEALCARTDVPCEVLLIDNASSDDTAALLERIQGARVLPQTENLHFLRAANLGATQARGDCLLFLNNDAQVCEGAMSAALGLLDEQERVGAVGGKVVLLDGHLQEAGSIVWSDGSCSGYGRGRDPQDAEFQFRREVDFCSGAFLMVRRALFNALGGLDLAFAPAYYEETDLCMRIRQAGYRVVYDPRIEIRHYEFGSSDTEKSAIALMEAHRDVFATRHAQVLADGHRPHGTRDIEVRQRDAGRQRVLVIDDCIPVPSLGSGFPRAQLLVRELCDSGAFVSHYPLASPLVDMEEAYRVLPREVEIVADLGISGLTRFLRERMGYYDVVIVSRPHNMDRFLQACQEAPGFRAVTTLVYDAEAIFASREALRAEVLGHAAPPLDGHMGLERELQMARSAHCVLAVSAIEADRFRQAGCGQVRALGHGLQVQPTSREHRNRRNLLFVGRLQEESSPNADSMLWFVREVMPLLDQRIGAGYGLDIVGRCSDKLVAALGGARVVFHGRVEDVQPFYDQARVFVAPTRFAAGIPLKVQEAAAHGVPVVATDLIAEQLGWGARGELLHAATAEAFADACARLYLDEGLWDHTRQAALAAVAHDCSVQAFRATVRDMLDQAKRRPAGPPPTSAGAQATAADLSRTADTWNVSPQQREAVHGMNWMAHPRVVARLNHKASGDEGKDAYGHLQDLLTRRGRRLPLARVASLGCGFGALERGLASIRMATRIEGYDIAEEAVAGARALAVAQGLDAVHYEVADLEQLVLPEAAYDLVVGFQSIHHVNDLDRLFAMVRRALRPGGVFHLHEYVGPDRFQWTDAQLFHMNQFLQTLPERYHRLPNRVLRGPRERPRAEDVIACDPTEAVHSSLIIPALERHFQVIDRRALGGALLHIGLSDIAQNFSTDRPEDMAHMERFFDLEDRLMAEGVIGSDFAVLTAVSPAEAGAVRELQLG